MFVKNIELLNFRNYEQEKAEFIDGTNIVYGDNGQGKTNLLEAVYVFTSGKSFRTVQDSELIKFGEDFARVFINFEAFGRDNNCEIIFKSGKRKLIKLNGVPLTKTSQLLGSFPTVIFSPDELSIITGSPEIRRKFTDISISVLKPVYYNSLRNYLKIVKQKNNLLKIIEKEEETLNIWNEQLAVEGERLMKYRKAFYDVLFPATSSLYKQISDNKEELLIKYSPSVPYKEESLKDEIIKVLERKKQTEIYNGMSLFGPHRDDIEFYINGKNAKSFASQGQQRTIAVALKIAQAEAIKNVLGEDPLLLLDDIMSELDEKRRNFLTRNIQGKQIILTCTDKNMISGENKYIFVKEGKLQ